MAYESPGIDIGTFTAAADLSAKQFYFVKLASATTVNVCTAITDLPIGILQNDPASGEQAVVRINSQQQATVALPASAHCHSGSKIRLVRHDDVAQHDFRAADPPCAG